MNEPSAKIEFTKMQGSGNDFIIIDNRVGLLSPEEVISLTPALCNRRFGIGADGLMTLQQSDDPDIDYTMFYRNADGSDAGMCGNGARCLALYASGLGLGEQLIFNVHGNVYQAEVNLPEQTVTISFPMQVEVKTVLPDADETILQIQAGTEHIVIEASGEELSNPEQLIAKGRKLRNDPAFNPPGTNVNFILGTSENELDLQTYERGVEDLTLACGTGAIASALAWHHLQELPAGAYETLVNTKGGKLQVHYAYDATAATYKGIRLKGKAQKVFEGIYAY